MPTLINNFSGSFIGIVHSYDAATRELEVFIPKLMPIIPEGRSDVTIKTNSAIVENQYNVRYNNSVKSSSTIKVKSFNIENEMPKVGSRVIVRFIEENPLYPVWIPFNYNGDYEIIDEEKYPQYSQLKVGDKTIKLNKDDVIEFIFPEGLEILKIDDTDNPKHKTIKIKETDTLTDRVEVIEECIGNRSYERTFINRFGKEEVEKIDSSGLLGAIQSLETRVAEIEKMLSELKSTNSTGAAGGTNDEI